jgi:hypothetical protein
VSTIEQLARAEDRRHWRRFQRSPRRAQALRVIGTAVGAVILWATIIAIL